MTDEWDVNMLIYGRNLTVDVQPGQVVGVVLRAGLSPFPEPDLVKKGMELLDIPHQGDGTGNIDLLIFRADMGLAAKDPESDEPTKQRDGDQPLPEVNDGPAIQDLVIADIEERKEVGLRRYGTLLQAHNGRDMLLDAYEEALDLAIYLKGCLEERASQ